MKLLVDASVAVKWVAPESDSALAFTWLDHGLKAPDFLLIELTSILWKKAGRGEITAAQALAGLKQVESTIDILPVRGLESRALEIGLEIRHSTYDCFYLAMAEALGMAVLTADQGLIESCVRNGRDSLVRPLA